MGKKRTYGFEIYEAEDIQRLAGTKINKVYNTKDDDIIIDCIDEQGRLVSILFSGQGTLHFYDEANPKHYDLEKLNITPDNVISVDFTAKK